MSGEEKLIERIPARPSEADFADVRKVLELFGWELRRVKESHHSFKKAGFRSITIPTVNGRKVKRVYLDQICTILGLDD